MSIAFRNWLTSGTSAPFFSQDGTTMNMIIRVQRNENFDCLFVQRTNGDAAVSRKSDFRYAGIYCKEDGWIYDVQAAVLGIAEYENWRFESSFALQMRLQEEVRVRVEKMVGNNKANLNASGVADMKNPEKADDLDSVSRQMARSEFLNGDEFIPLEYGCSYEPDPWMDETLMEYILDPDSYEEKEAQKYINECRDDILWELLRNEAVQREFTALANSPDNPVHFVKKIMSVMRYSPAKTVTVTIQKNGIEFTFKEDADKLRKDWGDEYSHWTILERGWEQFGKLFDGCEGYSPKEIVQITYGRKVLYSREQPPKQTEVKK